MAMTISDHDKYHFGGGDTFQFCHIQTFKQKKESRHFFIAALFFFSL